MYSGGRLSLYLELGLSLCVVLIQVSLDLWCVLVDALLQVTSLLDLWLVPLASLLRPGGGLVKGEQLLAAHPSVPRVEAGVTVWGLLVQLN